MIRRKIVDPILYRLGYLHHSNTIGGILSGDTDTIDATVDGYLVFPDGANNPDGINIEFVGIVVDPHDDRDQPSIYERVYALMGQP